jgi:hypothetical protein
LAVGGLHVRLDFFDVLVAGDCHELQRGGGGLCTSPCAGDGALAPSRSTRSDSSPRRVGLANKSKKQE